MNLVVIDERGERQRFPLIADRVTIGRATDNVICLTDRSVSRHHAELRNTAAGWQIADLSSRFGTIVNRRRIDAPVLLFPGDHVRIGGTALQLDESADDEISISISDNLTLESTGHAIHVRQRGMSDQARAIADAVRAMISGEPLGAMLKNVVRLALDVTKAHRGMIALVDESGGLVDRAVVLRRGDGQIELSRGILRPVLEQHEAVILRDTGPGTGDGSPGHDDVRSVLCTPLVIDEALKGVFYLDSIGHPAAFDAAHLEVVSTLAALAGVAIQNDEARRDSERTRQLSIQLEAAAEIQQKLLPPRDPSPPAGLSAAAWQSMCHAVGGDYYDFAPSPHGYVALLADVAGKRLDGALIMANLHATWSNVRATGRPVTEWLGALNEHMLSCLPENRFITIALAVADLGRDRMLFANAGHNTCYRVTSNGVEKLPSMNLAIGIMPGIEFEFVEHPFEAGDRLFLYSDGLLDQLDPAGEPFGEERLEALLARHGHDPPGELRRRLLEELDSHSGNAPQDDDITIAILGREPSDC